MTDSARSVVVASDAFKGSLTSIEVGDAVRLGMLEVAPEARVVIVPVADGGEGTVTAALGCGWDGIAVGVHDPTGEPVTATLAVRSGGEEVTPALDTAAPGLSNAEPHEPLPSGRSRNPGRVRVVVEMADACGLGRLPGGAPAPLTASSRGLGEAMRAALDLGVDEMLVGVGGSASTDGGAGMLAALGARLLDAAGHDLPDGGAALVDLDRLDLSGLDPRLRDTHLVLAADVDSPLLGPSGAAAVFGPQKGATASDVAVLEAGLTRWSDLAAHSLHSPSPGPGTTSTNRSKLPQSGQNPPGTELTYWSKMSQQAGAGAAGGVGFALLAVLGAERRSGIDVVLDLVGLDVALSGADLVVTGEGALDHQTLSGKAVTGVVRRARTYGIPAIAVCGRLDLDDDGLATLGLRAAYPLSDLEPNPARSIRDAAALLRSTGRQIARDWLSDPPA